MNTARNLNLRAIYFETAKASSIINKKGDGTDFADATYTMHDADGAVTTDETLAVRTTVDVEPVVGYEIGGGILEIDGSLSGATLNAWFFSCMALPDIAAASGGSIEYVNRVNLEMVNGSQLPIASIKTSILEYSDTLHTNKLRMVINHPVGIVKRFQILIQLFC